MIALISVGYSVMSDSATPRTVSHQVLLSMEFSRQEYWSGLLYSPPRDLPDPSIEPVSRLSPALAGGFFTISTTWEALLKRQLDQNRDSGRRMFVL